MRAAPTNSPGQLLQMKTYVDREHGFSLVELMIAMVLGLLIIGGATSVFMSNKQSYQTSEALSRIQENSRVAFEFIARDLRGAALTGCGNVGRVANVLNNGSPKTTTPAWYVDFSNPVMGYGGTATDPAVAIGTATAARVTGTDALTILGAADANYGIASHILPTSGATPVSQSFTIRESSPDLAAGDLFIICDPDHATIAQVSSLSSGTYTVSNGGSSPGNCSNGLGYPTQCTTDGSAYQFAVNSQITKLKASNWYIGNNPKGGKSLYRVSLVNSAGTPTPTAQEMVRDVISLSLLYHLNNGTGLVDAAGVGANWGIVDAVQVTLRLQAKDKMAGTTSGQLVYRDVTASIALRNRTIN